MKKLILFLSLMAYIGFAKAYNFSAVAPSGQTLYYTISGNTAILTFPGTHPQLPWNGYVKPTGILIIPDSVLYNNQNIPVVEISSGTFNGCTDLTSVTIGNNIYKIGTNLCSSPSYPTMDYSVFWGCTSLNSVTIPNSVNFIGNSVFYGCSALSNLVLPAYLSYVGHYAFANSGLNDINIPGSLSTICRGAFKDCTNLSSVTIESGVSVIEQDAFNGCVNLLSISVPITVTSIGTNAFSGVTNIEYHGSGLGTEGYTWGALYRNAYYEDSLLYWDNSKEQLVAANKRITIANIPESVIMISADTFNGCNQLSTVNFNADSCITGSVGLGDCPLFVEINFGNNVKRIPSGLCASCSGISSIALPSSLRSIGDYSFNGCTGLTSILIPSSVQEIGSFAFYGCSGLSTLTIPDDVFLIGQSVCSGCTGLLSVNIGNGISMIPDNAFSGCTGLASVNIPNSVTDIGSNAFGGCTGLTSIIIPSGVTNIGSGAFDGCSNIATVSYNAVICQTNGTFQNLPNLTTLNIGNAVQYIPSNMFSGCTGLASVNIPNSVTGIGNNAFNGCIGLTSITIPSGVTNIGSGAFSGCNNIATVNYNAVNCQANGTFQNLTNLTTLNIGDEVQYIPSFMFRGCTGLVTLNVPNAVTEIGSGAFYGCSNLTSATLGDGLATIGSDAFSQCTRLTSVSLGEGITSIGNNAFMNCGIIGELVIPQGVISIGNNGFKDCFGITEITCLGRVAPTLGEDAFDGVDTGITVNIPCGTTNLYAGRWSYFHNFNEIPFLFNVASANLAQGTVVMLQEPTCDDPVAIVQATPRDGYRFDHWSDGSTQNPYTYTAMGSLTLTAYFASTTEGIDDIEAEGIRVYAVDGRIVVEGADVRQVRVFDMMGRCVDDCSYRLKTGVYLVKVGNLPARKVVVIR